MIYDDLLSISVLTLLFELATCFFRFGLKLESTRDTAHVVGRRTRGVRVHHGYLGVALALMGLALLYAIEPGPMQRGMLVLGYALAVSDLVHHFLVLWPITGDPQFDLVYPDRARYRRVRARG